VDIHAQRSRAGHVKKIAYGPTSDDETGVSRLEIRSFDGVPSYGQWLRRDWTDDEEAQTTRGGRFTSKQAPTSTEIVVYERMVKGYIDETHVGCYLAGYVHT